MKPPVILVFAKCPEPGRVNTRLCPPLTPAIAADLHVACVAYTCQCLVTVGLGRRIVVVSPDDSGPRFSPWVGEGWEVWPQGNGDLGDRLRRNIERAYSLGHRKVLCLGADSPTTPPGRLDEAVRVLDRCRVCLGPCEDGGIYVLGVSRDNDAVGAAQQVRRLLEGIPWGASTVAEGLRVNAERNGGGVVLLDPWYDIDRPGDLVRAAQELDQGVDDPVRDALLRVLRDAESMI